MSSFEKIEKLSKCREPGTGGFVVSPGDELVTL